EQVETLPEIAPKCKELRLVRMTLGERMESLSRQARGKYLYGNVPLARCMHLHSQPIALLYAFVGDGNASDGHAISMEKNISAGIRARTENSVGAIRVADVQAQEKIALRIEPIEFVEALRHLHVAELPFRP